MQTDEQKEIEDLQGQVEQLRGVIADLNGRLDEARLVADAWAIKYQKLEAELALAKKHSNN